MKKFIPVLIMIFVVVFSAGVLAGNFEFVGGGIYTTLQLTELNNDIDELNNQLEDFESTYNTDVAKLEKFNSAFGFFGGAKYNLSDEMDIGVNLERFAQGTGTSINYSDEFGTIDADIDMSIAVNGLVAVFENKFGKYMKLNVGAGYYSGTAEMLMTVEGTGDYSGTNEEQSDSINLNGFGYKAGVGFDYPLPDNEKTNLFADLNYRMLKLNNVEDAANNLNADGIELRAGICYKF